LRGHAGWRYRPRGGLWGPLRASGGGLCARLFRMGHRIPGRLHRRLSACPAHACL